MCETTGVRGLAAALLGCAGSLASVAPGGAVAADAMTGAMTETRAPSELAEIVVRGRRDREAPTIAVETSELVAVPGALGDPISAAFSLPGVVYAGGDTGLPAVRGSGPGDNLYLVDSLPVPYVFHALDIGASVFSDHILGAFDLRSAAFGAEYANVTGAVFDIGLRDPRRQPLATTIDLSMLRSGVFLESAVGERGAAYLSYRASMVHLFVAPGTETDGVTLQKPPRDDDYQARYVVSLGARHALTLGLNGASDAAAASFSPSSQLAARDPDFGGDARLDTRYDRQTLAWDYDAPDGTGVRVAAGRSRQSERVRYGAGYFENSSVDRDIVRGQVDRAIGRAHTLHLTAQWHRDRYALAFRTPLVVCNEFDPTCTDERRDVVTGRPVLVDTEQSVGVSDTWLLGPRLRLDVGAAWRRSSYTSESLTEPRAALEWRAGPRTTLSLRGGRYSRFPDAYAAAPVLGNPRLRSSRATHVAVGLKHEFANGWSVAAEPYYKRLSRLPLAIDANEPDAALLYANDVRGRAYGVDVLVRAPRDERWSGWMAFTLSRSDRTNERAGVRSRYFLDTPVIANAVVSYQWRPTITLGARATVRSGQPDTPIVGATADPLFPESVVAVYGTAYADRLPTYYRLDLRIKRDFSLRGRPSWVSLDLINATGARNVAARSLDYVKTRPGGPLYFETEEGLGAFPAISFRTTF